uniref:Uncharacterized protein n=1 Tax=Anguilla anguilla TaxID=7936 RepID=A0A0E9VRY3_ANGAN
MCAICLKIARVLFTMTSFYEKKKKLRKNELDFLLLCRS